MTTWGHSDRLKADSGLEPLVTFYLKRARAAERESCLLNQKTTATLAYLVAADSFCLVELRFERYSNGPPWDRSS